MLLGGCLLQLYSIPAQTSRHSLWCLKITWQSICADYDWKLILVMGLMQSPIRSGPHFIFFSHNPGLCQGFAVVTSAFKTWTCVTGRACVHTAPVINNNPYCACIELHGRAEVTRPSFIKTSVLTRDTITPHTSAVTGSCCYCYRATFRETHWVNLTCSSA